MHPSKKANIFLIVPVFNEAGNLERLFQSFDALTENFQENYAFHIILVDDGSTDGTNHQAESLAGELNLVILRHQTNLGPGKAFGTAFRFISDKLSDDDWVVTMEGDNTSRVELLKQMFIRKDEGYPVVLASPYMYGGGIINTTPIRTFLSNMANVFVKEFLGIFGILTVSSFYRLYQGSLIRKLQKYYGDDILELAGFECMVELLLKMIYLETPISEVPLLLDTNLRVGKSKMKIIRTIMGYFKVWQRKKGWRKTANLIQTEI